MADVDDLNELEDLLERAPAAKEREKFGQALDEAAAKCNLLLGGIDDLERWGNTFGVLASEWEGVAKRLEGSLAAVVQTGQMISSISEPEELGSIRVSIKGFVTQLENILSAGGEEWKKIVTSHFESARRLGSLLQRIPDTGVLGQRITAIWNRANALMSRFPPTEYEANEFKNAHEAYRSELTELKHSGVERSVEAFLSRCAEGAATLHDVDEQVLRWLNEHHAGGLFTIHLT